MGGQEQQQIKSEQTNIIFFPKEYKKPYEAENLEKPLKSLLNRLLRHPMVFI